MLEGLEATEVRLSELENNFTVGSEFYSKAYVALIEKINSSNYPVKKLSSICSLITDGDHNAPDYKESGIFYLLSESIQAGYINKAIYRYISQTAHNMLAKSALRVNDVLVTKTGIYFGKSAVVPEGFPEANTSAHVGIMRLSDDMINPYYLSTFINSKFGYQQFRRRGIKATRPEIKLIEFNDISIVQLPKFLQVEVEKLVKRSAELRQVAENGYSSAENYLLECLGMQDFAANPDAYNVKTLKESFLESGRIDAEFYLSRYEDYIRAVSAYTGGVAPLGEVCTIKDSNYTPECDMKYRYIELANIGKSGDITGCLYENGEDLPTRARRIVTQGDVIVSSIEGSLSSCALITDDYDQSLCSTGFYVVRSNQINPETLLTLFKSLPIQQLLKKACSGTILTGIGKQEFEKIPIPLIRPEVQEEIAQHVQRSFALRKEASELLEKAKLSVEYAIETGGGNSLIYSRLLNTLAKYERLAMWLLLKELGIVDESPNRQRVVTTEKRLSESFFTSGRLDAEYYQPKYDYLDAQFSSIPTKRLGDIVNIHKSIEPGSDAYQENGIPFVRVADLSKFGIETSSICLDSSTYSTAPRPRKNTILLSKDGSVGIAYKMEEDADIITSGAILHLRMKGKELLPDYLTLVLNSPIVRMQAERDAGGSIIQHWKLSEISQVIIPMLPVYIQQKLSDLVSKSFAFRRESKALLERAKAMVEQAIEFSA